MTIRRRVSIGQLGILSEMFLFVKVCGWSHSSWWWIALFVLTDALAYLADKAALEKGTA